jgi:hypothetical protein
LEPRAVIPRRACTASCPARAPCLAVLLLQVSGFWTVVGWRSAPSWVPRIVSAPDGSPAAPNGRSKGTAAMRGPQSARPQGVWVRLPFRDHPCPRWCSQSSGSRSLVHADFAWRPLRGSFATGALTGASALISMLNIRMSRMPTPFRVRFSTPQTVHRGILPLASPGNLDGSLRLASHHTIGLQLQRSTWQTHHHGSNPSI